MKAGDVGRDKMTGTLGEFQDLVMVLADQVWEE